MKSIIILGPARVGKSTLASLLCEKYNLNYISGDSIRNAFINIYPELNYSSMNTIERIDFCNFIKWVTRENNIHLKREIHYVIDSAEISIENAQKVFNDFLIIVIGAKDISIDEMVKNIKKYDTELEWTYRCNEEELKIIAKETIGNSKKIYNDAEKNNVMYFDTSFDREKVYDKIVEYIEGNL
ncbi:MAG: hypothetical protein IJH12_03770 [Clostridia bacterium]|nr:hypothetical protein [Clostridia bacterium]